MARQLADLEGTNEEVAEMTKKLLVIVGFNNWQRKSLLYKCCTNPAALHKALDDCLERGATVMSIRVVEESGSPHLEPE